MRATRIAVLLVGAGVSLALGAANAPQDQRTLKDLQQRRVEVRRDAPSDGNAGKAMENYRRFLELRKTDPALRAEALRRLGDLSLESGELERLETEVGRVDLGGAEAIRLYTLLLRAHPDYPRNDQVLYQLARAYETTGQPEQALATLDQIVRRFPQSREIPEVQFRRGELLFSAMKYREAEQAYAEVTRPGSGDFYQQALYKQGWSLFKQNLNDESLPVFGRLLDLKLRDARAPRGFRQPETLARADREIVEDTLRVMSVVFSYQDGIEPLNRFVTGLGSPPYSPLLYARLGDLYVEKQRYQDAASAYRAFVAREPNNEYSPTLSTQAIEAYRKGGFAQLVLDGKREYVENYNLGTAFWQGRDKAKYPQLVTELKTHLTDLAAYHHSEAQKHKRAEDYAQAARWYRLQLASFPQEPDSAQVNFRLADVLYEGGQFGAAVDEYERSAYAYPPGPDSARAGYAALSAYQKQEPLLPEAGRAAWHMRGVESGVKFAQTFPGHPDGDGVLTRATEDLYKAKNLPRAIEVAGILLARNPPATAAQRRIAASVTGQARFDLGEFAAAERSWLAARDLAAGDAALQKSLTEQLSVAVYRQAEAKRAAGDAAGAVDDFLRVARVAPGTPAVEAAQYDAAAELIKARSWPRAIEVLEAFRRDYPQSRQQGDVTQKLAVAYMESGRSDAAAGEFERIAQAKDSTPEVRLEALTLAAAQYEKSGNTAKTVALLEKLVAEYPTPAADRIETRQKLADFAARTGNAERVAYWQREIVKADAAAGAGRTDRTRYLAANASLALAAPTRDAFRQLRLTSPLNKSLAPKRRALDAALNAYKGAAAYNVAEVVTQSSYEIAELYRQLGADLMASERPKSLKGEELEQYDLLLEEQATPFEEQAIKLHEANAARVREGIYDDGVKASYGALAKLLPARFGKTEAAPAYHNSLALPRASAPPEAAPPADATAPVATPAAAVPAATPPSRLESQLARAVTQANGGATSEAELEFKQLLEAAPEFGGAAYDLGVLLRAQNRLEEAEAALAEAVRREPASAPALTALGLVQRERGNLAAAEQSYGRALEADAGHAPAHRNLGILKDMYQADAAAALPHLEQYKALTGEDKPVTSWIADVKQRAGRGREGSGAPPAPPEAGQ
ncbi:MAG TPA: tetratricopeptide repeat protein [Steroidobacteraceae bacterium]|nr:tetratricopeptide repeat protein [Steroidobacteraceae bacterium]